MVKANATQIAAYFAAFLKRDHPVGGGASLDALVEFGREVWGGTVGTTAFEAEVAEGEVGREPDGVVGVVGVEGETGVFACEL
jgi:hypothetical protein